MLTLRLTLTAPPLALLLRLLLLCASAGIGLLLLATLSYALEHPGHRVAALVRLLWCLVPLAVAAQLAAALGRTEPRPEVRSGLDAAGLGPARLPLLAARTAAVPGLAGSALVLLVTARGDIGGLVGTDGSVHGLTLPGAATGLPLPEQPLPAPAVVTLLSTVPLLTALAAAWGARSGAPAPAAGAAAEPGTPARSHRGPTGSEQTGAGRRDASGPSCRAGLLWGAALTSGGLLLAAYAPRVATVTGTARLEDREVRVEDLVTSPLAAGWLLAAFGLMLAGPGLAAWSGRLLGALRPGPVRLLAGRTLVREALFLGRSLGALSAVAAALVALARARLTGGAPLAPGPLVGATATLTGCCVAGAVLAALTRARHARAPLGELLDRIGAPRRLGRAVTLLRAGVLWAVFTALATTAGLLTPLPPH
ncbi:hypothetical protein KBZ21_17470 [Streptomyces sp. A73]|uniref:hypothetical protein n=1 Tax=Streptomyces smyrnaeus TaxID=1387713 RepID=UPI000C180276|nr:hypothetical protein [Streptomyces sp. A73]